MHFNGVESTYRTLACFAVLGVAVGAYMHASATTRTKEQAEFDKAGADTTR
jgi:hypothetical protein